MSSIRFQLGIFKRVTAFNNSTRQFWASETIKISKSRYCLFVSCLLFSFHVFFLLNTMMFFLHLFFCFLCVYMFIYFLLIQLCLFFARLCIGLLMFSMSTIFRIFRYSRYLFSLLFLRNIIMNNVFICFGFMCFLFDWNKCTIVCCLLVV